MDMKKILQAMDGATTKAEVNSSGMKKFLQIVNEAELNQPAIISEGKSPHKVKLPVQMAMQHYQAPVKKSINETSVFKTYVALVENDIAEQQTEKQQLIRQYSQRIAESVLMKERVVGGEVTPPGINRLTGKPIEPQPEPAAPADTPAVVPLGKRFDPRFKNGPEPYTIDIDGVVYKFAGRNATGPGTGEIIKVPAAVIGIRGLSAVSVELGKDGMYYPAPATNESAPSASLSKAKKSATVKKAKAGKDIGKPGKGFDELAKKTNTKVAAAAMWKNIKR